MSSGIDAAVSGFALGLSLILAIGAQNAFVLRQGLRREHVFLVCLICAVSDALLILAGVIGINKAIDAVPWLAPLMRYGGALFLFWYGARSLLSAWRQGHALSPADAPTRSAWAVAATCLALTWLNPHVYLDTVLLVGSMSSRFPGNQANYAAGAMLALLAFFFALGYGAALLRPVVAKPAAWRVLEAVIGVTMWVLAGRLALG